jgi:hypothetical protein
LWISRVHLFVESTKFFRIFMLVGVLFSYIYFIAIFAERAEIVEWGGSTSNRTRAK